MNRQPDAKIEYGNYVVAFVDILGTKALFEALNKYEIISDSDDEGLGQAVHDMHQETTVFVSKFRDFYRKLFESLAQPRAIPDEVPREKIKMFKEARQFNLKMKGFSDCLQVYAPLRTKKWHCHAANAVYAMVNACGASMLWALAEKKVIRAGIDLGIGVEISDDEVYGPALFKAYELEARIADYPRVVVGESMYNYLQNLAIGHRQHPDQYEEDLIVCRGIAAKTLKVIKNDYDGRLIVDYLSHDFLGNVRVGMGEANFGAITKMAISHVYCERDKHIKLGNKVLIERYKKLEAYMLASDAYRDNMRERPDKRSC